MRRSTSGFLLTMLVLGLVLTSSAPDAHGQGVTCLPGGNHIPVPLGTPDAAGVTREDKLASPGEKHGYYFTVPKESSGFIYLGDQWFDIDLYLYSRGACAPGSWEGLVRAWSVRAERRSIQFVRPDEQVVQLLPPGEYLLIIGHKYAEDPQFARDFNPERGFTVRIALNAVVCGLDPRDEQVPNPLNPAVPMLKRPDAALYQLAMTMEPAKPGPFSLMSFNAIVSPPYTDLFDFTWQVDGRPVVPDIPTTIQVAVPGLQQTPGGTHTVRATARGVRVYPDPDQPHIPLDGGTLTVECTFTVGTT